MPFRFPTPVLLQREFVHKQLDKLHDHLASFEGRARTSLDGVTHPAELVGAVRDAVADALNDPPGRGDYYSHDPLVNLVQSALDQELDRKRLAGQVEHDSERMGDPFTKVDIGGWVGDITLSLIQRLLNGSHPFNDAPANHDLKPNVRLVLLSDWGTGRQGAAAVARIADRYIRELGCTRFVHVVHLGDTYYSGTRTEQQRNLLTPWPVSPADANLIPSWALNGNHDMYSGGHGLFETVLSDPRFARQQANGQPTSWMVMRGEQWNVLGLDTAWRNRLVELVEGKLEFFGALGHLHGSQSEMFGSLAHEDKRLLVLSHHQLFVAYGGPWPTALAGEIQGPLAGENAAAWFWGHEHDCLAYDPHDGVGAARAIGHGAIPEVVRDTPCTTLDNGPLVKPVPDDTLPDDHPLRAVRWEYRDYRVGADEQHWTKHGFAVVDIDESTLHVRYVDDEGSVYQRETI